MAPLPRWSGAALAATALLGSRLSAQPPAGTITGRVVNGLSRAPVPGATVRLAGTRLEVKSGPAGEFTHHGLVRGVYIIEVQAIGYAMTSLVVRLAEGDTVRHVFELEELTVTLPPVEVEGQPSMGRQRQMEFERRREAGRGYFLTEEQISASGATTLGQLLRAVPGVRVICTMTSCVTHMLRAPRGCRPDFYMDGFPANNTANADMLVLGVVGIEIYRTSSETPIEFLRSGNRCGTVVIWTRSGPS